MTELPIDGCKLRECNSCVLVTVTIARAIELKHAPGLIAALAYDTASFYQKAGEPTVSAHAWDSDSH
jgi:hypothetical protein